MARQTVEMAVTKKSAGQIFNNFDPMFDSHIYRILEKPQGYNKFLVPPPVGGQQKVELNMSVEVTKILKIDEVEGSFRTKLFLRRHWLDPRLSYRNLKKERRLNKLSPSEAETVFFPNMVFENIASAEDWVETVVSKEHNIVRNLEENFEPVEVTNIDNAFIFSGAENSHSHSKEFTVLWNCDFNMMWYPFDTQVSIIITILLNQPIPP